MEKVQNDAMSTAEESKSETMQIVTNTAANLASEATGSASVSVAGTKIGKICKHTWKGTKCQIQDSIKVHIDPCQDRECRALDDGLPLYKTRNCQLWHVKPRGPKVKNKMKKHNCSAHEGKKPFKCESCEDCGSRKGNMKKHIGSVHDGKKPFKSSQTWNQKGNKYNVNSNLTYKYPSNNINSQNNGGKPKNTFRPPPPNNQNLPSYNAWFPTLPTPLYAPPQTPKTQGNESATIVQPLFRGGNPNSTTCGQHPDQIQMISEVCQQVLRNLISQPMQS